MAKTKTKTPEEQAIEHIAEYLHLKEEEKERDARMTYLKHKIEDVYGDGANVQGGIVVGQGRLYYHPGTYSLKKNGQSLNKEQRQELIEKLRRVYPEAISETVDSKQLAETENQQALRLLKKEHLTAEQSYSLVIKRA